MFSQGETVSAIRAQLLRVVPLTPGRSGVAKSALAWICAIHCCNAACIEDIHMFIAASGCSCPDAPNRPSDIDMKLLPMS